jgi:uncharacterized protein YutE (UPF0331/DUF86 family)
VTPEAVHAKLALLRDNLEKLAEIPQGTYDEFASDFRNLDSALHRLQTSIQALIDLGSLVVAQRGLGVPDTSRDLLVLLEKAGHLPVGAEARFGPIFGFRNRVVHLYDRIDPQIVFRILTEHRGDLEDLAKLLVRALSSPSSE